jgi:NADH:ubiquinone oxidoreductase subunit H
VRPRDGRGFVAIEWVAAVALLLLPVVVLVATLPSWAERRHAATVAAREAATAAVGNAGGDRCRA